jgi:hypothetical protein
VPPRNPALPHCLAQGGGMSPELMQRLLRDTSPVGVLVDVLVIASHLARVAKEGVWRPVPIPPTWTP